MKFAKKTDLKHPLAHTHEGQKGHHHVVYFKYTTIVLVKGSRLGGGVRKCCVVCHFCWRDTIEVNNLKSTDNSKCSKIIRE